MQRLSQVTAQKVEEALRSMNYETWNQYRCVNNTVCDMCKHFIHKSGMDLGGHDFWPLTTHITTPNLISSSWSLSTQLCQSWRNLVRELNFALTRMDNNTAQRYNKRAAAQIRSDIYHRAGKPAKKEAIQNAWKADISYFNELPFVNTGILLKSASIGAGTDKLDASFGRGKY